MEESTRWIPYCGEAPGPDIWLSRWNLDPVLGAVLLLLALALFRSSVARDLSPQRLLSLRGAWALTVVLYVSPLCALSSAFFTMAAMAVELQSEPVSRRSHGSTPNTSNGAITRTSAM